jgi:hypothetical protein
MLIFKVSDPSDIGRRLSLAGIFAMALATL